MNDSQIIAIAIIFVAALASVLYNNSRISDLRTDVGNRITDLRNDLGKRFDATDRHIEDKFNLLDTKLDRVLDMLAGHDSRLHKLEGK